MTDDVAATPALPPAPIAAGLLEPPAAGRSDEALEPGWTVRPGGLLDVNPVARLLRGGSRPVDIDGDGVPDGPVDEEAAAVAARLLLLHVVLERGRLDLAEAPDGTIAAAAVWVPAEEALAPAELGGLLTRELHLAGAGALSATIGPPDHVRPQLEATMTGFLDAVAQHQPDLVLYAVAVDPSRATADVLALARDVVAPVIASGEPVLALALDADRARLLVAAGFDELEQIPLGELNTVWVGQPRRVRAEVRTPITA